MAPKRSRRAKRRQYLPSSLVLRTEWETSTGTVWVTDFMPPRDELPNLVRIVECVSGKVDMRTELVLRFDYGRLVPWVRRVGGDLCAVSGPDAVCLRSSVPVHGEGLHTRGEFTLSEGESATFVLSWHPSHRAAARATARRRGAGSDTRLSGAVGAGGCATTVIGVTTYADL